MEYTYLATLQRMESDLFDSFYLPLDGESDPYAFQFLVQLAIYVHCVESHDGQFSDKYRILCYLKRMGFNLSQWEYAREEETANIIYQHLAENYK